MGMLSRFNPTGGIMDFWQEFRRPQPYRVPILLLSIAIPAAVFFLFGGNSSVMIPPQSPDVTYITTYAEGRTDEEIIASNIENQKNQDALDARRAMIEERKREAYRSLGAATGLDVEEMEREAAAERAREEAAAAAERRAKLDAAGLEEVE